MRKIIPIIGSILITHSNYTWVYIGDMKWRCIGNNATMYRGNWKIGDIYTDPKHPINLNKGDRYFMFNKYLELCNTQESSATKKTS